LKVLQVVGSINTVGGIEQTVQRLSNQLIEQAHETILITAGPSQSDVPYPVYRVDHFEDASSAAELELGEAQVVAIAREYNPDVILTQTIHNPRLLLTLNGLFPTVEFLHVFLCEGAKLFRNNNAECTQAIGPGCLVKWYTGPCGNAKSPARALRSYRRGTAHRDALKRLPAVFVTTEYMRAYLANEGLDPSRLFIANHVIDIPPELPACPSNEPKTKLLYVGRVTYNKGVQNAVSALKLLDSAFTLTVVGDGWYLPEIKKLAENLGVVDRVRFTGFLRGNDLDEAYREAEIVVVPSIWPEPAGIVVPEARGRGLRVVVNDVGGLGEWDMLYGYSEIYKAIEPTVSGLADAIKLASTSLSPKEPAGSVTPPRLVADLLADVVSLWRESSCAAK